MDLESAESVALVHEPAPKNGKEEVMSDIGLDDEPALPRQRAELALEGHAEMHSPVREIRSANGYWLARLEQYSDKGVWPRPRAARAKPARARARARTHIATRSRPRPPPPPRLQAL